MTKRILVVDDDRDILEALNLLLSMENYNVQTLSSAQKVCNQVSEFNPDLIILDVALSGYDGRVICKKLKSKKETKNIPVIMISAHPTVKPSVFAAGADAFIPKPFDVTEILTVVKKH